MPEHACCRCRKSEPEVSFYRDKYGPDGLDMYCKECRRITRRDQRARNREGYRAKAQRVHARHPARYVAAAKRQERAKPKAARARAIVTNELRRGRMKRQPCEVCGSARRVHGHHDDYDQPLVVRWLCTKHHSEWHEQNGPGANLYDRDTPPADDNNPAEKAP